MNKDSEDNKTWEIYAYKKDYYFTDRISVILEIEPVSEKESKADKIFDIDLAAQETVWGDFRLYDLKRSGRNRFTIVLQPRKTGLSVFKIPSTLSVPAQFELQINSFLSSQESGEKSEALPLIEEDSRFPLILIIISVVLAGIAASGFLLFRNRKKTVTAEVEITLSDFLSDPSISSLYMDETACLQFYRDAYRLLLKDLCTKHPEVKLSDSPLELIEHLETPSALNQWALRSLYPWLEYLDKCFYAPPHELLIKETFSSHLEILRGWLSFECSEKKEADK